MEHLSRIVAEGVSSLPSSLASGRHRELLGELAAAIPWIGEPFGFECRLAAGEHPVDFGFAMAPEDVEAALAPDVLPSRAPVGWSRLRRFASRWRDERVLRDWIPFLFLEFDSGSAIGPLPSPSVFAALDSPLDRRNAPELAAAEKAVSLLGGAGSRESVDVVRRAHGALPATGRLLHVGVMLGRPVHSIRLSVLMEGAATPRYLASLGAHDAAVSARRAIEAFGPLLGEAQLDFDGGPSLDPRIGFGIRAEASRTLAAELTARVGACPAKISALQRWPGTLGPGPRRKRLSHLKLACAPDRIVEAKAYLEVSRPSGARTRGSD
jgi:hypothetical protein